MEVVLWDRSGKPLSEPFKNRIVAWGVVRTYFEDGTVDVRNHTTCWEFNMKSL